jgi:hypothetical protein
VSYEFFAAIAVAPWCIAVARRKLAWFCAARLAGFYAAFDP